MCPYFLNLYMINGIDKPKEIIDIINIDVVNQDSISMLPSTIPIVLFKLTINK